MPRVFIVGPLARFYSFFLSFLSLFVFPPSPPFLVRSPRCTLHSPLLYSFAPSLYPFPPCPPTPRISLAPSNRRLWLHVPTAGTPQQRRANAAQTKPVSHPPLPQTPAPRNPTSSLFLSFFFDWRCLPRFTLRACLYIFLCLSLLRLYVCHCAPPYFSLLLASRRSLSPSLSLSLARARSRSLSLARGLSRVSAISSPFLFSFLAHTHA